MVNLVNITSLLGAATLVKIFDFQGHSVNLGGNNGAFSNPIISFPATPGAANENWFLNLVNSTAFTIQSFADTNVFLSYAGLPAGLAAHSQILASGVQQAAVFQMEVVNSGPAVNVVEVVSGAALTAWQTPDPTNHPDPSTPSFTQSFTLELGGWFILRWWSTLITLE
ncbi:hypothetical protein B0H13DRAFT_1860490 [Mycena leptocephala]|nr:hypothetical protein B0H13DRAFT_1860490 [Mycena leptocephala]